MDAQAMINLIGTVLYIAMCAIGTTSIVVHLRVIDWRSTMSVHLLIYQGALALTLDLGIIKLIFGDSLWFQMIRLAAFALLPLAMAQRLYLQVRAQRGGGRGNDDSPPADSASPGGTPDG